MEDKRHDNLDDNFDEDELYGLDKLSLDENKWRKYAFENELKVIYIINWPNGIYHIYDK